MESGFYWYLEENCDPLIVKVGDDGDVLICGQEAFYFLPSTGRTEYVLHGRFVGPISPPVDPDA